MDNLFPSGSKVLDYMLNGGYETDIITTIYGPAGSGKTNLMILAAVNMVRMGKKVIYFDTEGGFSVERLKQIAPDYLKILNGLVFLSPVTFEEQKKYFEKLKDMIDERVGLIIVDTIAMLYRLELGKSGDVYNVNSELGRQLSFLSEIARKKKIPALITNQVYADFENKGIRIVGGDLLKYSSKCMIELQITDYGNRKAVLQKHRSLPKKELVFKIVSGGIIGIKCQKSSTGIFHKSLF